jgi:sulfite oxidase
MAMARLSIVFDSGTLCPMTRYGKRDDMVVHQEDPYNAEPPPGALVSHLTDTEAFYTRNHGPVPAIDPAEWRLEVDGLVGRPSTLSLADLHDRYAEHTITATLQCAGNRRTGLLAVRPIPGEHPWDSGATSNATWTGVRLADVLADSGVDAAAKHVWFAAPDVAPGARPPQPYGSSISIEKATAPEVLLAWAMNGEPLTPIHGAPLRVVVPGWIGARSVKWLTRVTVAAEPSTNYFQAGVYRLLPADPLPPGSGDGGFPLGPIALSSAILSPADGDAVPAGELRVHGYAYAGENRTVSRVEVSGDGGATWRQAQIDEPDGPWTWQHWRGTVDVASGRTEVVARAWDSTGALQPASAADVWNPKGYLNTSWARVHVDVR